EITPKRYEIDPLPSERLSGLLSDGVSYVYPMADGRNAVTVQRQGGTTYVISVLDLFSGESEAIQTVEVNGAQHISHVAAANLIDIKSGAGIVRIPVFEPQNVQRLPVTIYTTYNPDAARRAAC